MHVHVHVIDYWHKHAVYLNIHVHVVIVYSLQHNMIVTNHSQELQLYHYH